MFGPRQVGEVIVGSKLSTLEKVSEFDTSAKVGDIGVFNVDGSTAVKNKPFYFIQKTSEDAATIAKGLGTEFTDRIDPKNIEKISITGFKKEDLGVWEVSGFAESDVIREMRTYEVEVKIEDQLSPENFEQVFGYYTTGVVLGKDTAVTVRQGLIKSLQYNFAKRGDNEVEVKEAGDKIVITEKYQPNVLGKKDGRKIKLKVRARVFDNISSGYNGDLDLLTVENTTISKPGNGTGKWATNYEWFCKGYKYDPNREFAHPVNFEAPMYAKADGEYDVMHIIYFAARTETSVERQYKVLTVIVEAGKLKTISDKVLTLVPEGTPVFSDLAQV